MTQITIITGRSRSGKSTFIKSFVKKNKIAKENQKVIDIKTVLKNKKASLADNIFTVLNEVSESATVNDVILIEDVVSLLDADEQIEFAGAIVNKVKTNNLKFVIVVNSLTFILAMKSFIVIADADITAECYMTKQADGKYEVKLIEDGWANDDDLAEIYMTNIAKIGMLKQQEDEITELKNLPKVDLEEVKAEN